MRQLMTRFLQDESGSILMITGLLMAVFIALSGAAYDLGSQQLIKAHTQQAMDAATVSGAVTDQDNAIDAANIFWELNYPELYMGEERPPLDATIQGKYLTLSAEYTVDTGFTKTVGTGEQNFVASSRSPLAEVLNPTDLILVVDNSLSMAETDTGDAFILPADKNHLQKGHPGAPDTGCFHHADRFKGANEDNFKRNEDCVMETEDIGMEAQAAASNRLNALRYGADLLARTLLEGNDEAGENYNQVAMVAFSNRLSTKDGLLTQFEFKQDYAGTIPYIMSMFLGFGTNTSLGMEKAWDDYAPEFRDDSLRVVVLLTDGKNNVESEDAETLLICEKFKQEEVLIFTVLFGDNSEDPERVEALLKGCATYVAGASEEEDYFYYAKDSTELKEAFEDIIKTTNQVRLIK